MTPIVLALLLASPDSTPAPRWQAGLTYGFEAFVGHQRATWQAGGVRIGRRFAQGTLIGEVLTARRYAHTDRGFAADLYRTLRPRAYGNLRLQLMPGADVLPRLDATAELFQATSGGYEFSAGLRRMEYASSHATILSAGVAKYLPRWYLRARALVVPHEGATGAAASLQARRYLKTDDDFVDLSAGLGREVVTLGTAPSGPVVELRKNRFVAARVQHALTRGLGLSLVGTWSGTDGLPDRRGLTAGVTWRW